MITQAPPVPATPPPAAVPRPDAAVDENLYLIGRPTLRGFLRFMRNHATDRVDEYALSAEWRAAWQHVQDLQQAEAGLADNLKTMPLGRDYEPLLIEFLKDPLVRHGFNTVPTDVAFVELDRLVVHQKHIDLTFVRSLQQKLGRAPTADQIFRTCLPFDHPHPPVKWSRVKRDTYVFVSPSNDLRFLKAMSLQSGHITGYPPPGSTVGVVGLAVGFGSNFMNAIRVEDRIILNNGSHRAYALRGLGVTHVPCIVQHAGSRAELELVAGDEVHESADEFLKQPRPQLLKDYFDPRLRKIASVHRRHRQVTVRFEVEEVYVPAL